MEKEYKLDLLKVIALAGIILAHVDPPPIIFQIRNFDVPLMIMISVWLGIKAVEKSGFKYFEYIRKRIKRLVIPTWIFLTIYFLFFSILGRKFTIIDILFGYTLISGAGVWIIRVYIYIALMIPILNKIEKNMTTIKSIVFVSVAYLTYYIVLVRNITGIEGRLRLLIEVTVLDIVGYGIIVYIAIMVSRFDRKKIYTTIKSFSIILVVLMIKNNFEGTQNFKYPIQLYYMAYAIVISLSLFLAIDLRSTRRQLKKIEFIEYISNNSMNIYLVHIIYIQFINKLFIEKPLGYIWRFSLVAVVTIGTVFIGKLIKSNWEQKLTEQTSSNTSNKYKISN